MTDELNLHDTEWDCCIVGNGVVALWIAHAQWAARKSVLWITTEEPYGPGRALLQHGWLWSLDPAQTELLRSRVAGVATRGEAEPGPFEVAYFDARSTKRFRRMSEAKAEWGAHEAAFFKTLGTESAESLDLWDWQSRLHSFHDSGVSRGFTRVELATDPRFVRVQGWPVLELKTEQGRLRGATLAGPVGETVEVRAKSFYLGDFEGSLGALVKNPDDAERLSAATKHKIFRAGLGLHLRHGELTAPLQTLVVPMIVSPEKDAGSHVVGRFTRQTVEGSAAVLESHWITLLTDEELEDNNEILKKIKQAKRAIERAVPGFAESIKREAVTFEPRMRAIDLNRGRHAEVLGAVMFSDHYGPRAAVDALAKYLAPTTRPAPQKETPAAVVGASP